MLIYLLIHLRFLSNIYCSPFLAPTPDILVWTAAVAQTLAYYLYHFIAQPWLKAMREVVLYSLQPAWNPHSAQPNVLAFLKAFLTWLFVTPLLSQPTSCQNFHSQSRSSPLWTTTALFYLLRRSTDKWGDGFIIHSFPFRLLFSSVLCSV